MTHDDFLSQADVFSSSLSDFLDKYVTLGDHADARRDLTPILDAYALLQDMKSSAL
jgi:hypothetical protein